MNALIQLNRLPETRAEQKTFVHQAIEELMNGEYDMTKFWIQATIIADTLNEIKESSLIKQAAIQEVEKYNGEPVMGCNISVQSKRTYDFSTCNYQKYMDLKKQEAELEAEIKSVEMFLKSVNEPVADMSTGEQINPPTIKTTEYITVK